MISKILQNSRPSSLNFKIFSWSLEQFFLKVGQNNFGNKIPFLSCWAFQSKGQESKQFQHSFDLESPRIFSVHNSLQTAQPTLESIKYLHFWLDIPTKGQLKAFFRILHYSKKQTKNAKKGKSEGIVIRGRAGWASS